MVIVCGESGFCGILPDVADAMGEMFCVSDEPVVVIFLPAGPLGFEERLKFV